MASLSSRFTLRQLAYAIAVADDGTMAGAADRLNVSQSAVSLGQYDNWLTRRGNGLMISTNGAGASQMSL